MKILIHFIILLAFLSSCSGNRLDDPLTDLTCFVDPYIGSDYHGHVFVGASVPFGAVQLGPKNPTQGWDWCSGYNYSDSVLIGFAHTGLSGTGIGDLGDILFMPVGNSYIPGNNNNDNNAEDPYDWKIIYSHNDESLKPGYYSVYINKYNIEAELTASERVGFHRYNYKNPGNSKVLINLKYGTGWDKLSRSEISLAGKNSIKGLRFSSGWAKDQRDFYYTEFSKEILDFKIIEADEKTGELTAIIEFEGNGELMAKTAISPVSIEGARNNLAAEIDHWDFDRVYSSAKEKWNKELEKIIIETPDSAYKRIFYTALYHTMIAPSLFNDANGDYRGANGEVYKDPGFDIYTVFSLWDTYRAAHPLYTIIQAERSIDFINSMLAIYEQQGKLPIWHLKGNETNTMVGYHAVPVIADAYLKGLRGFGAELAFEAMKNSALLDEEGQDHVKELGFIPADSQGESVAKALEYAIDDWCIAAMARAMGKTEDYDLFSKRAMYYKNYFDNDIKFMRGKMRDGSWRTPFNPYSSQHRNDDLCEGNSWQYTWLVPQDVEGLIELHGGEQAFIKKLDSLFSISSEQVEGASSDISGLIGQYAHGNEPGHHITYLYPYAGQQWKTAEKVREICTSLYSDQPDGLCGNEDCGQMSAWYILSAMGMYPVNPAAGIYVFGSPLFDRVEINLPGGNSFKIIAENNSSDNLYIQSVSLNGHAYKKSYISHDEIIKGGMLVFKMGNSPKPEFGADINERPK